MATLYRKHRPQNFKEIVGQTHIKTTLEHEIESNRIAHAYLFCGPRGIGKTTIARIFSKSINCLNRKEGEYEPCNTCKVCVNINLSKNLDIIEIDAASHTGVDNVRENIIAAARISPGQAKYKVFIIDEVHMLSISAFNALLKVLEEPPKNIIFILCTTEVHKIPATIISRCQRFDFKRIGMNDIIKKLNYIINKEKITIENKILEDIARQSEGHMRDAESILGQIIAIGGKNITAKEASLVIPRSNLKEAMTLIELIIKKDATQSIALINKLLDDGMDLSQFLIDVIELQRKILLQKLNPNIIDKLGLKLGENIEIKINEIVKKITPLFMVEFINEFMRAKNTMKDSFIAQLPLELAIAKICQNKPIQNINPTGTSTPPFTANSTMPKKTPFIPSSTSSVTPTSKKANPNLNIKIIKEKWHEVLAMIKQHNHSLSFILRVCEPRDIKDNQLCLAFRYKFHKDRISENNIKSLIEKVLSGVYGENILIEAIIDEKIEIPQNGNGNGNGDIKLAEKQSSPPPVSEIHDKNDDNDNGGMVNKLIDSFGGKVIA